MDTYMLWAGTLGALSAVDVGPFFELLKTRVRGLGAVS